MSGPLSGITVVDITTNISGPSLTMILADLGADIIKIERPVNGDDSRGMGPFWNGEGVYFLHINRNKKSVVIDLKQDAGRRIVYDLVEKADVFVENFRYKKAEKMGLGYEKLKEINPSLVYCSLSAYGQNGPLRERSGYDAIAQADSGIIGINGAEGSEIARVPVSVLDQGSAMWGAIGIISALFHKEKTGEGQLVTTSLYETGVFWVGYHMLSWLATGKEPRKNGAGHTAFAPYGAFYASDAPVMIGISNNSLFSRLCKVLGKEEWVTDTRYETNPKRVENRENLRVGIENILQSKTADEWVKLLTEAGVPSSKVKKISEVAGDEQVKAIKMWESVEHSSIEEFKLPRLPFELSISPAEIKQAPPKLGENSKEILKNLGYCEAKIEGLLNDKIVQTHEDKGKIR
ncbi:CaiB/BaiF CoA transferase family protein [Cytobacillus firmus]|uniref:L-carnitine dehydratase/bile acid-inducible protein F n=1 Tax=Cytobacillus firmus DS1 TaxID=1307436 RepID=W7L3V5_CYTFI|nr:CaiB/BaiF CoA-transferase family protein [Cytobacillus firmus]EWG10271.1 L-carnitine dehydratase/bile acid-inducible protein F [Cytobacillus firmus DS1]MBG9655104.1 formyl-CoA transferase [Cytobacillus firmus]MED1908564.1 CaiB/BaiF CoA-transferase family protein [Cytobacillus firmus]